MKYIVFKKNLRNVKYLIINEVPSKCSKIDSNERELSEISTTFENIGAVNL